MRKIAMTLIFVGIALVGGSARADCKDEVRELRQEINDNRDKYTREARAEAQKELVAAQAQIASPLVCREHLRKARRALRQDKD